MHDNTVSVPHKVTHTMFKMGYSVYICKTSNWVQPTGPIYQRGPASVFLFLVCSFNNSWNVFAVLRWPHTPQYISLSTTPLPCIQVGQSDADYLQLLCCTSDLTQRMSLLYLIWILQTLQRLGFKQQMCLLAICYTVCPSVGTEGRVATRGYRLQIVRLLLCGGDAFPYW